MAALQLKKDGTTLVKILSIEPMHKRPTYTIGKGTFENWVITVQTKQGETGTVEYTTENGPVSEFVVGIWQEIVCLKPSEMGCVVKLNNPDVNQSIPAPYTLAPIKKEEPLSASTGNNSAYNANMSGKAIVFAMSWSHDFLIEEMKHWEPGREVNLQDLQRVVDNARFMAERMVKDCL